MISQLEKLLREIATRRRRQRFHGSLAVAWLVTLLVSFFLWQAGNSGGIFALSVVGGLLVVTVILYFWSRRGLKDPKQVAKSIEKEHPDLQTALLAAIEQNPNENGDFSYLQQRLLVSSLTASEREQWVDEIPKQRLTLLSGLNVLGAFLLILFACSFVSPNRSKFKSQGVTAVDPKAEAIPFDMKVEPGNVEVERGSPVTIQATFGDVLPSQAFVEIKTADGKTELLELVRPFTGPIYQTRIESVSEPLEYKVVLAKGESERYQIDIYDRPALVASEADCASRGEKEGAHSA